MRDAKAWAAATETRLRNEKKNDYKHVTLLMALERYLAVEIPKHRGAVRDAARVNRLIRELPVDRPLHLLTKYDFNDWRDERAKTVKGSSVNRDLNLLKAFFNHCIKEWDYIQVSPIDDITRPKQPPHRDRIITKQEIDTMLQQLQHDSATKPTSVGKQVAVCFLLALETGMRAGELCGLTWDRVHIDRRMVYLHTTKNGKPREVPLSLAAIELLQLIDGVNDGNVFIMSSQTLDAYFRKARKNAGLDGFTFHDARHTAATRIAKKLTLLDLCKMFGWQDPKKAMVYYNPTASEIAMFL
jgi:integrase